MFELMLNEDYEDNYNYRDVERANKDFVDRREFEDQMGLQKVVKKNGETIYKESRNSRSRSKSRSKSRNAMRTDRDLVGKPGSSRNHTGPRKFKTTLSITDLS